MIPLPLRDVAELTGGELHDTDGTPVVTGSVEFDSRKVGPGSLFVALPGERVDGHSYAGAALEQGAVGVLAARPVGVPAVVVPDVRTALGDLAHGVLDRLPDVTVIGLTGSTGKTSTKDLLAQVLGADGPTVAPPGSFNNEIGHPYTVLLADAGTRYLVLENSARGIGHIAALCRIARPRIGLELNVGTAHLGEFGSREAIAQAKGELVEALPGRDEGGIAVLNADDDFVRAMAFRTRARVVSYGLTPGPDVTAESVTLDAAARPSFTLRAGETTARVELTLVGRHNVVNALAAAAVALQVGMPLDAIAAALSAAEPRSRWRMEVRDRSDGVTVVNDAYNANPASMRAALSATAALAAGRRWWAVLGEMGELGPAAPEEHVKLGAAVEEAGPDRLLVVGAGAAGIAAGAGGATEVADAAAAIEVLRNEITPGDVVLVKASRAVGLERVALALLEEENAR